jgi:hypothetical protein
MARIDDREIFRLLAYIALRGGFFLASEHEHEHSLALRHSSGTADCIRIGSLRCPKLLSLEALIAVPGHLEKRCLLRITSTHLSLDGPSGARMGPQ